MTSELDILFRFSSTSNSFKWLTQPLFLIFWKDNFCDSKKEWRSPHPFDPNPSSFFPLVKLNFSATEWRKCIDSFCLPHTLDKINRLKQSFWQLLLFIKRYSFNFVCSLPKSFISLKLCGRKISAKMVFLFRRTRLQNQIVWLCPTMFFLFHFFFFTFYFCTFTFFFLLFFIAYFDFFFTFTLNFPVLSVFVQTRYFYFWGRQIISRNHRRQTNNETISLGSLWCYHVHK